jgi:hypothetical protein
MKNFDLARAKNYLLEGEVNSKDMLIKYFTNYPKTQALAIAIADDLGEALTPEVAKNIIALADGYGFESPQR